MDYTLYLGETDFLSHYIQNAPQIAWFLGAGASRTAGMPTATDITWDLKRSLYCLEENQDIQHHDINNEAIRSKIQTFMDSKGHPKLGSPEEYSFYFDLKFKSNYSAQQQYINEQVSPTKISLNMGNRVLAALLGIRSTKAVFTTNFDSVLEEAFSNVMGESLTAFHIEGSYAALDALNNENYPIYVKMHGDFRYKSIKNLEEDLLQNDAHLQNCFLAAANRFGLVVAGYSGRDKNVMAMFDKALEQSNAFPKGLFWIVTNLKNTSPDVIAFIEKAQSKGIKAHIVEAGTFDMVLSKIWKQIPNKAKEVDDKVHWVNLKSVNIPLPKGGSTYPLIRTNALPITSASTKCAVIEVLSSPSFLELRQALRDSGVKAIITKPEQVLAWGSLSELNKAFTPFTVKSSGSYEFNNVTAEIKNSTFIKSFYEDALAHALVQNKPLLLRRAHKRFYLIVDHKQQNNPLFQPLKSATATKTGNSIICGSLYGKPGVSWAECVSIKLEERGGNLWLLLKPDIWIDPPAERENNKEFIGLRRKFRFNPKSYEVLGAWVQLLFDSTGNNEATVSYLTDKDFPVKFTINARSAYSKKDSSHA